MRVTTTRAELVLAQLGMKLGRQTGTRAWCLCPWHQSPNDPIEWATAFFVRLRGKRAGQSHCFTCKKGGALLDLVQRVRGLEEPEARKWLTAALKGYEPPRVRPKLVERSGPIVRIGRQRFAMPREVIVEPLAEWVTPARAYAESRGLTAEEVERFGIGYAVDGRLGGRIVLPWLGKDRVLAGYSARTYCDAEEKYLTPHESEHADRTVMFGEHLWPEPGPERRVVVVTEGGLNALAARRATGWPVAAIGGSEVETMHLVKLSTFALAIVLTDPDLAGEKAAAKFARMLVRYTLVRRPQLPAGLDALDVQLRRGLGSLREILTSAP